MSDHKTVIATNSPTPKTAEFGKLRDGRPFFLEGILMVKICSDKAIPVGSGLSVMQIEVIKPDVECILLDRIDVRLAY